MAIFGVGVVDVRGVKKTKELPKVDGKRRRKIVWVCPYYKRWIDMLRRCYAKNENKIRNTYENTIVCNDWHRFSNFKYWMENQDWEGKDLDKDILGDGDLYSPETCCFVPEAVNNFLLSYSSDKYTGVTHYGNRFYARHAGVNIGSFLTFDCARSSYIKHRNNRALEIAETLEGDVKVKFLEKCIV